MSDNTTMTTGNATEQPDARGAALTMRPMVNIFEDVEGITLEVDMPGVAKEGLAIQADQNTLLIEGDIKLDTPQGIEALYADVRATRFSRSFTLSSELDVEKVDASLKDGVLGLRIPKRAEVRPRKIEVRTD
jgi:HSP20 family molecular chaperone IbpA